MESTIKIPLSRGMVALIDGSDFDKVKDFPWHAKKGPRPYVRMTSRTGKKVYMHRVITGAKSGQNHKPLLCNKLAC